MTASPLTPREKEDLQHHDEHASHEEIIRIADDVLDVVQQEIERGRQRLKNALARYEERMHGHA